MKTKLFILAMLLMPMMFGCSKDNSVEKQIVGDWFLCYYKVYDHSTSDYYEDEGTFTQETSSIFISFYGDGTLRITNIDPDFGDKYVSNGTWSIEDGNLIMTIPEDGSVSYSISFENDNLFYWTASEESYSQTLGFQRM